MNIFDWSVWWRQVKTKNCHGWSLGRLCLKLPDKGSLCPLPKCWRQQHHHTTTIPAQAGDSRALPTTFVRSLLLSCVLSDFSCASGDCRTLSMLSALNKAWRIASSEKWGLRNIQIRSFVYLSTSVAKTKTSGKNAIAFLLHNHRTHVRVFRYSNWGW